jgi:hypothetical protein
MAAGSLPALAGEEFLGVQRLVVNGEDVTAVGGVADLEVEEGSAAPVQVDFSLRPTPAVQVSKLAIGWRGGVEGWPASGSFPWNRDCRYDPASRRGSFRFDTMPLVHGASYEFSVDASRLAPGAPKQPVYSFPIHTYPALRSPSIESLPFYTIRDLRRRVFLDWPAVVYEHMSRQVPPNTSLSFAFQVPQLFWKVSEPLDPHLRVLLVRSSEAADLLRPVHRQADLPRGEETVLYDGSKGGEQNGFKVRISSSLWGHAIWVRKPAPGGPVYQNLPYLEPGGSYSLQFELTCPPYLGKRYEATRFEVRAELPEQDLTLRADYAAPTFVDWQGDWYNGHLLGADDTPTPGWGWDYVLQKQMRDQYPDLWRMIDFYYLNSNSAGMFFEGVNLYRDRSTRLVTRVEQRSPTEAVATLAHFLGAENFRDPDHPEDRLNSHAVVADASEAIFRPGDALLLQSQGKWMEARVKAVRPERNQLVLAVKKPVWPVKPEGPAHAYPAVLGEPGSLPATITLAADQTGTYLRHRNGRPFVNWAILDYKFDFFVHTMGMRVCIEQYTPHAFVGDAETGSPSAAGWQLVSDCSYYLVRHLLKRHHADLDTFNFPIYGEGTWKGEGGSGCVALYDYFADGVLRAYEEVLGVRGEDYKRVRIGVGGIMFAWGLEPVVRKLAAHTLPAPLEQVFPDTASPERFRGDLPSQPLGTNPLYYFTAAEREEFHAHKWQFNACFLDDRGRPLVGPGDWDAQGKLTGQAIARLKSAWGGRHSRWLFEHTRFGKGTPFRQLSTEGYSYPAEQLAKCILFEKELLAQLDRNLRLASSDPYVQTYLQGVESGTRQLALFSWAVTGSAAAGRPFQGTGYWPTYFAEVMRRILFEAAKQPRGIYDHGTFTYDSYIAPDPGNGGLNSDSVVFAREGPSRVEWFDLGEGKRLQVISNQIALEKDVRHFVRFLGMMSHRLAALPERNINGHVVSGIMSKFCETPGTALETGNGPGDEHRFWVLLYDHYPPDLESQDQASLPLTLQVRNLPGQTLSAQVTVYRVDRDHSSVFTLTEELGERLRREKPEPSRGYVPSAAELEAFKQKAKLARDEDFARNGDFFRVSNGSLDLPLTLGANRVLFVEIDWEAES